MEYCYERLKYKTETDQMAGRRVDNEDFFIVGQGNLAY